MTDRVSVSEKPFEQTVVDLAILFGWDVIHRGTPARRCPGCGTFVRPVQADGHPDLELVRGDTLIYLELKGARGRRPTERQVEVVDALKDVRRVFADVAYPKHLPSIEEALR